MLASRGVVLFAIVAAVAGCAPAPVKAPSGVDSRPAAVLPDSARDAVVYAVTLVGTPYRYGGTSPGSGFDCSGLVWHVYRQAAGLALPRTADEMGRAGRPVEWDDMRPGDLVFYNTLGREFSHVGIYIGEWRFVHAPSNGGKVEIVSMGNTYWARRFSGARRVAS